ncbi:unnamed protein product, partial [marine sediment metagenome]
MESQEFIAREKMKTDYNNEDILGNVKHPICPLNLYFEGGEDKCDTSKCDFSIDTRSCTEMCRIKGDKNMAGDKYDEGKNRLGLIP